MQTIKESHESVRFKVRMLYVGKDGVMSENCIVF